MPTLTPTTTRFILHWGEMGTRWGINRTVAQIHALLFVSPKPLTAEEIAETLSVARSNVSTSLKELQGWGIIRIVHAMGDRRDHFESIKDVWELYRQVMDERHRVIFGGGVIGQHDLIAERGITRDRRVHRVAQPHAIADDRATRETNRRWHGTIT